MSFWEIEDVVEQSITCLKKSNIPQSDICSLIFTLCKFGNKWTAVGGWYGYAEEYECDTRKLKKLDMLLVVQTIANEAEKQHNFELLQYWYAVIQWMYAREDAKIIQSLQSNPEIIALRTILSQAFVNSDDKMEGLLPTMDEFNSNLEGFERAHYFGSAMTDFLHWWYEPYKCLLEKRANNSMRDSNKH
jgi:hypothetical protein